MASNGPKDKIEYSLELTGLLDAFKGKVFSAFDANSWKPEPDLIMYSAMNMGFYQAIACTLMTRRKALKQGLTLA